jgi:TPR repeat protein
VEDQVPEAINFLGVSYRDGLVGLVKSAKKAAKLFKRAVELGNLDALSNLGHLYAQGDRHGVKKDNKKAMQLFRMAADRGCAEAQAKVAAGLAIDSQDADVQNPDVVRYWKLAAAQGFTQAEFFLGQGYHEGFYGLDVDIGEGLRWYARAAAKGHEESIAALDHVNERLDNLADMMKRDGYYLDAARHYKLSVEQTASLHAMYHLGEMNYNGQGFDSRNYDEARRLWERAAAGGHEGAIAALAATAQHYAEDD